MIASTPGTGRPIRCLIIQLTRLGDTLQSLMALRAAQQLYPQLEITFVARERFAAAARRVPWLKNVVTLPTETLLGPVFAGKDDGTQALRALAEWVEPLARERWDLLLNWSYSEASSYLTGLIPARIKLGYSRSADHALATPDGWSHYIQAIVQGGIHQNIHLTDVLTTQLLTALQIHFGEPADNGNAPVTSKDFFGLGFSHEAESRLGPRWRDRSKKWIAIQLGAGNPEKAWAPANWGALVRRILTDQPEYGIVLLGGSEDVERSQKLLTHAFPTKEESQRILTLVGRTDFDLWATVVGHCHWIFSADTAAIHLASVLGTRVVNLSLGPVRFHETGPYGNGHYVLSSEEPHPAPSTLTPEQVYGVWSYAIHDSAFRNQVSIEKHFASLGMQQDALKFRAYRSRIRGTSDGGGVVYESITKAPLRLNEWTAMVMGHIARAWYCGWVPPIGHEITRAMLSPELLQQILRVDESAEVLAKICDEAHRSAVILNKRTLSLKSEKVMKLKDREELRDLGRKLLDLDHLIERMGKTQAPLLAFSQMARVLMHNLQGKQLSELGRESAESYRQLGEGVSILRDWIRHTRGLARPVAIRPDPIALPKALPPRPEPM